MSKKLKSKTSLSKEEQEVVVLNKKHEKLVETLKKALVLGNIAFIKAGQVLSEIKDKKTYESEDLSEKWTWRQFLARPDLPFPGSTPDSRRRTADALIRIYRIFIEKHSISKDELAPIGWAKLNLLAPLCDNEKKASVSNWLDKARVLSVSDLVFEIKEKDQEIGAGLQCQHPDEFQLWFCPECGARSKNRLSKKKK